MGRLRTERDRILRRTGTDRRDRLRRVRGRGSAKKLDKGDQQPSPTTAAATVLCAHGGGTTAGVLCAPAPTGPVGNGAATFSAAAAVAGVA